MYAYNASSEADNLLEQVLQQGERLRSSIVKTIVRQDPFYSESTSNTTNTCFTSDSKESTTSHKYKAIEYRKELSLNEKHKFLAYMKGDPMSSNEEKQVLDTFRSLSTTDLCDLTSRSFTQTQHNCRCDTCQTYNKTSFAAHAKISNSKKTNLVNFTNYDKNFDNTCLQYVDSLKIALHSFTITDEGKIKVCNVVNEQVPKKNLNFNDITNITYFIEYEIPNSIRKTTNTGKQRQSRVDSGFNSNNVVKLCSKRLTNNVIYFKQISLHEIALTNIGNLENIDVKFKITCRTLRQKKPNLIGVGNFNFAEFYKSSTLTSPQELIVCLTEDSPIVTGTIKVQLQLGCDKLYFGKEFLDSVQNNKENVTTANVVDLPLDLNETFTFDDTVQNEIKTKNVQRDISCSKKQQPIVNREKCKTKVGKQKDLEQYKKEVHLPAQFEPKDAQIVDKVLFGFIFITEAEYLEPCYETYFALQPFCQNDFFYSNSIRGGSHPCFNFHQVIPYIYDDAFIFKLRDNHMIIEFFRKGEREDLIGICKIPLHQYYLAFRNPTIVKYLERNKLPVIGTDWYEPIYHPTTGDLKGNVQILVALGSEEQVHNLQKERGFMDDIVKRARSVIKTQFSTLEVRKPSRKVLTKDKTLQTDTELSQLPKTPRNLQTSQKFKTAKSVDKSTLVTPTLTLQKHEQHMDDCNKVDNRLETIQTYLQQLVAMKTQQQQQIDTQSKTSNQASTLNLNDNLNSSLNPHLNHSNENLNENQESCTNVIAQMKQKPRSTADLLNTLQSALNDTVDTESKKQTQVSESFKAQIVVESALHLPARKKYRVKKVKGKTVKEELLPSTYVSYEIKDGIVKTSQVVQKSTSPGWNLRNDVALSVEYLTNKNRRLIFKVWKKSNNGSTIPNMQIDTIIGFASLDLTVLLAGLPTIEGWFNIMDFSNKCNGQIKINVIPLENISKYNKQSPRSTTTTTTTYTSMNETPSPSSPSPSPSSDEPETLSRALKRKFNELDEISQRLKTRLNHVTEDIDVRSDADTLNDDIADEFEKDINTLCIEEDYDQLDFAREAQDLNMARVSSSLQLWQDDNPADLMIGIAPGLEIQTNQAQAQEQVDSHTDEDKQFALQFFDALPEALKPFEIKELSSSSSVQDTIPITNLNLQLDLNSETSEFETSSSCSLTSLDKELVKGKERIDHLLQKLTLMSKAKTDAEAGIALEAAIPGFSGRYVSGCSSHDSRPRIVEVQVEADILSELGIKDFDASKLFDATLVNFDGNLNLEGILSLSSASSENQENAIRDEPDGEGNTSSDDKQND